MDGNVVDISVLKEGFKRAAWYSLALTLIVTIVGEYHRRLDVLRVVCQLDIAMQFPCQCFSPIMYTANLFMPSGFRLVCAYEYPQRLQA